MNQSAKHTFVLLFRSDELDNKEIPSHLARQIAKSAEEEAAIAQDMVVTGGKNGSSRYVYLLPGIAEQLKKVGYFVRAA